MNIKELLPEIEENVCLAEHTTFKIGGPAKYFFIAKTEEEIIKAIKAAEQCGLSFFVLAGGSNVLFSDKVFDGLIVSIQNSKLSPRGEGEIYAEAGTKLANLVNLTAENSLAGLEWAAGIPSATIAGAIRGNAGAFGGAMADIVKSVKALDAQTGEVSEFLNKDCQFEYRNSIFKKNKNLIILSAEFQLQKGDKEEIEKAMEEHKNYRKKHHPLEFPSAGSVFKNPSGSPAGELIEKAGLKGKRIGGAQISEKHCNFIVNLGKAEAKDVLALIKLAKKEVKNKFGIELEEEIVIHN